jgi:hypothetical protein
MAYLTVYLQIFEILMYFTTERIIFYIILYLKSLISPGITNNMGGMQQGGYPMNIPEPVPHQSQPLQPQLTHICCKKWLISY